MYMVRANFNKTVQVNLTIDFVLINKNLLTIGHLKDKTQYKF